MGDKLLSLRQAADRLSIGTRTLQRRIERGEITYLKVGRVIRFDPADVDAYIERQKVPARAVLRDPAAPFAPGREPAGVEPAGVEQAGGEPGPPAKLPLVKLPPVKLPRRRGPLPKWLRDQIEAEKRRKERAEEEERGSNHD